MRHIRGLIQLSPLSIRVLLSALLLLSAIAFVFDQSPYFPRVVSTGSYLETSSRMNGRADVRGVDTGQVIFDRSVLTGGHGVPPPDSPMHESGCDKEGGKVSILTNHGWGVDIGGVVGAVRKAWLLGEPIQIRIAQLVHPGGRPVAPEGQVPWWHYTVGYTKVKADHYAKMGSGPRPAAPGVPSFVSSAPAVCTNKDLSCFFKPIPCRPHHGFPAFRAAMEASPGGPDGWFALFETRRQLLVPHDWLQREVNRRVALVPVVPGQCAVLHVRRSDTSLNRGWGNMANQSAPPQFRFIPLSEYIESGNKQAQQLNITTIFTITDDASVVDELNALTESQTMGRTVVFLRRKRFRGAEGGWENHFPSGSALEEVLTIMTIEAVVKRCILWIGTKSSFSKFLTAGIDPPIQYLWLSTKPRAAQTRAAF